MSRFVILYNGLNDPPAQEERALVSALKRSKVVDRMPGSILVDGPEAEVASIVGACSGWSFTREQGVDVAPPHGIVKAP